MKRAIFLLLAALVIGTSAEAQTIVRTDGQQITPALGTRLRRDGANVMVSIKVGQTLCEQGVQVSQIARIEFPEPAELKQAEALIGEERFDSALARIEPVFNAQSPFKDIPETSGLVPRLSRPLLFPVSAKSPRRMPCSQNSQKSPATRVSAHPSILPLPTTLPARGRTSRPSSYAKKSFRTRMTRPS